MAGMAGMAGARGGRWGSSTPTRRKSGEIRASEANRLQKQKDKHSERERDIYYIYRGLRQIKSQLYSSSERVHNSWIMLDFGVPMVRRCLHNVLNFLHHFTSSFWMCPVTPRSCQWYQRPCKASRQMGTQGDRERHLRYPSMHREKCVKKGTFSRC